ncbi:hypothetical protein [Micromonospora profundi]|uniref:hypothetical protein n=1 Tax=Micromonospora profundi TaxID=1420889 RepID=UPI003664965A
MLPVVAHGGHGADGPGYGGDIAELLLAVALFATWYNSPARRASSLRRAASAPGDPVPRSS